MAAGTLQSNVTSQPNSGLKKRVARITGGDYNLDFGMGKVNKMSIQVVGTWASCVVTMMVSNDNSNFYAMPTATTIGADGVKSIARDGCGYQYYRASFASGTAAQDLTISVVGT